MSTVVSCFERVLVNMKRKIDWDEEESGQEDSTTSDDKSDSEEPGIKDVLNNLSQALPKISCFGHPAGNCKTPVTNILELVEYILLPHNASVNSSSAHCPRANPRALAFL